MIKRTMYFYDKKQADLIKKVNDKLHRSRGVRVSDADINIEIDKLISSILKFQKKAQDSTGHNVSHISVHLLRGLADTARRYNNKGSVNEAKEILTNTLDILQRFNTKGVPTDINTEASNLIKRIKAVNTKVNDKLHRPCGVKVGDAPDTKIIVNILNKAAQEAAQQYNDNKGMGFAPTYKMLANKLIEFKNIVERMGTQYLKEEQLINAISSIKDTSAPKEFNTLKRDIINQLKKAFK